MSTDYTIGWLDDPDKMFADLEKLLVQAADLKEGGVELADGEYSSLLSKIEAIILAAGPDRLLDKHDALMVRSRNRGEELLKAVINTAIPVMFGVAESV